MRYYVCSTFNPNYSETIPDFIKQWCVEEECIYSELIPEEVIKNDLDVKERRRQNWEDNYDDKLATKIGEVKYIKYESPLTGKKKTYWKWERKGKRYYIEMDNVDADFVSMLGGKVSVYDTDRFEADSFMESAIFGAPEIDGMVIRIDNGDRSLPYLFEDDWDEDEDDDYEDDPFEQQ